MPKAIELGGEKYLTAEGAARALGVKPATLYSYASRGRLRSYRQGMRRRRLYRLREVEALLELAPASERARPKGRLPRAEDWVPYTA